MSLSYLPQYAAVHVISDIHMGGSPGFQILRETARLAGYIRRLAQERPGQEVALVLNGDVFDTLAEELGHGVYIAVEQAQAVVERIMDDASFQSVWQALAAFVQTPQRTLVFVIGNHDIEIAFPVVQNLLLSRLAGAELTARARIIFSTTGAGYTCMVGGARVYCTHGNEVDAWNYNRYEDLARVGRRLNAGASFAPTDWKPNAGTKMVKEVMNSVKVDYRWIDLLKPEGSAALGTLLVIAPEQLGKLQALPGILAEQIEGSWVKEGRLSANAGATPVATPAPAFESLIGPHLSSVQPGKARVDDLLLQTETRFSTVAQPQNGTLGAKEIISGAGQWLVSRIRGAGPVESLRLALKDWLKDDNTFKLEDEDDTYKAVLKHVGPAVDIVITGHTHLARAINMGGGRLYFNSGTWIRLMRFTDAMLQSEASFKPVYDKLKDGQMGALDTAIINGQPLLMDCTTEVEICEQGGKVVGRLNQITGDGGIATPLKELRRG